MAVKKAGCLGKILGVLFTSIVVPVLVNVFTQDMTSWQKQLGLVPEAAPPAARSSWDRPVVEDAGTRDRPEVPSAAVAPPRRLFAGNEERKGRESNPQGVAAEPFSRRSPAPMGWPFH
jgi:hypothetical protein